MAQADTDGKAPVEGERITASEAREAIARMIDEALGGKRFVVTRNGRDLGAYVGISTYERLLELEREAEGRLPKKARQHARAR